MKRRRVIVKKKKRSSRKRMQARGYNRVAKAIYSGDRPLGGVRA